MYQFKCRPCRYKYHMCIHLPCLIHHAMCLQLIQLIYIFNKRAIINLAFATDLKYVLKESLRTRIGINITGNFLDLVRWACYDELCFGRVKGKEVG